MHDEFSLVFYLQVLQNLGKADRTTDDVFNDIVARIERQQVSSISDLIVSLFQYSYL